MHLFLLGGSGSTKEEKDSLKLPFSTSPFDQKFISLTNKRNPNILFIPTAQEGEKICEISVKRFEMQYREYLNCETDTLFVSQSASTEIQKKMDWADCFYIPGGDPIRLLKIWSQYSFDSLFKKEIKQGKIAFGVSAGAMCFFEYVLNGYDENVRIDRIGLGLVKNFCMPHFNREKLSNLRKFLLSKNIPFLGIDDCVVVEITDEEIISWCLNKKNNAYYCSGDKIEPCKQMFLK